MSSRPSTARSKASGPDDEAGVNVQVLLRCRPMNVEEIRTKAQEVVKCRESARQVEIAQSVANKKITKTFTFDKVFGPEASQEDLYQDAVVPIVNEVLEGFNCTIFAYGQTGTGKTFTMEGGDRESADGETLSGKAGVIPRAIKQIFDTLRGKTDYTVKVSFLELYNEEITDLLAVGEDENKKLPIRDDGSGSVHVANLEEIIVKNAMEIYSVLDRGSARRTSAETLLNKQSSRSHSVFTVTIHMRDTTPEGEEIIKVGKLNLVDLAGSENISRSGAKDQRAREAGEINKSLLCLGRVISALVEKQGYVPYRDSKLTRLLRESLGGRTKTCIIATIAPTVQCLEETFNTLDYAHRAKNIRNKPEVNQRVSKAAMLKEYALEIDKLHAQLWAAREKDGVYLPADQYQAMERDLNEKTEQVAEMGKALETAQEEQAAAARALARKERQLERVQAAHREVSGLLRAAYADLASARQGEAERAHAMARQRAAEGQMTAHAESVAKELARTGEELAGAFAKIARQGGVGRRNREAMVDADRDAEQALAQMTEALGAATQAQASAFASLASKVRGMAASHEAHAASLGEQLAALAEAAKGLGEDGRTATRDLAAHAATALGEVSQQCAQHTEACREGVGALAAQLAAQLDAARADVLRLAADVEALVAGGQAATAATAEAAKRLAAAAREALEEASRRAVAAKDASEVRTRGQQEALAATQRDFEAQLQEHKAKAVQEMEALMGRFVTAGSSLMHDAVKAATTTLAQGHAALAEEMEGARQKAEQGAERVGAEEGAAVQEAAEGAAKLSAAGEAAASGLRDAGGLVEASREQATRSAEAVRQAAEAHAAAVMQAAADGSAAAGRAAEAAQRRMADAGRHCSDAAEAAQRDVREALASTQAASAAACADGTSAADASAAFGTAQASALAALQGDLRKRLVVDYAVDEETGTTPKKRRIEVPSPDAARALAAPAAEALFSEFRRMQETGAQPRIAPAPLPPSAAPGVAADDASDEDLAAPGQGGSESGDADGMTTAREDVAEAADEGLGGARVLGERETNANAPRGDAAHPS